MTSKEIIRWSQKLSWKKLQNASRVYRSFRASMRSGNPVISGLPMSISIEPTTSCNLRCPECPSGLRQFSRPTGMLKPETFQQIIAPLQETLLYLTFYFQGEPYLNPQFLPMVSTANAAGIFTSTSTNAHYLNEETAYQTVISGLDRIIISIDGTSQEIYEQYRVGGQLQKVIEGTKHILHWRKKLKKNHPVVVFQFLVVKPNEHQIPEVVKLAKSLGVDEVKFKSAQLYSFENGNPLIPDNAAFSRYEKTDQGTYIIKNKLLNHCWRMWNSCVITWDGSIVPCCFDKDAHHKIGNVISHPFKEVWYGEKYNAFRKQVMQHRKSIDICANCSEGTKVWL